MLYGCSFYHENPETIISQINTANVASRRYKRLEHIQNIDTKNQKGKIQLLISFSGRKKEVEAIKITFPSHFNFNLNDQDVKVCSYLKPSMSSNIKCLEDLSLSTKINQNNSSFEIIPLKPFSIESDYAFSFNIVRQTKSGIYQINAFSANAKNQQKAYLGSWKLILQ